MALFENHPPTLAWRLIEAILRKGFFCLSIGDTVTKVNGRGMLNGQLSFQAPEIEAGKLCSSVQLCAETTTVFWIMQVNTEVTAAAVGTRAYSCRIAPSKLCQSVRAGDASCSKECIEIDRWLRWGSFEASTTTPVDFGRSHAPMYKFEVLRGSSKRRRYSGESPKIGTPKYEDPKLASPVHDRDTWLSIIDMAFHLARTDNFDMNIDI